MKKIAATAHLTALIQVLLEFVDDRTPAAREPVAAAAPDAGCDGPGHRLAVPAHRYTRPAAPVRRTGDPAGPVRPAHHPAAGGPVRLDPLGDEPDRRRDAARRAG